MNENTTQQQAGIILPPGQPQELIRVDAPSPIHLVASGEPNRFAVNAVLHERREGKKPRWVATDGRGLAIVAAEGRCSESAKVLLPCNVVKIAAKRKPATGGQLPAIAIDRTAGTASVPYGDGASLTYPLRDGTFPPLETVVPDPAQHPEEYVSFGVDAEALLNMALALGAGAGGTPKRVTILVRRITGETGVTKPLLVMPGTDCVTHDAIGVMMPVSVVGDPIKNYSARRASHVDQPAVQEAQS